MSKLSPLVGQKLAGFKLTSLLGEGGMAAVFRGENLIDRSILRAIKVVQPALASDEEFTSRFAEEARVLERLQHPNVLRFYGARWEGEHLLMELEMLEGVPLSGKLRAKAEHPLPLEQVTDWIRQASEGLSAAHELDIVHRDLKPDNLFLTKDGVVKVLDFGIARALDEADRASSVTRAGTVPGTPAYLAPEVCKHGVPSKCSDVYAMGMTLLELLLGYHPYLPPGQTRRSSTEIMFAHVREDLPLLRSVREDAPAALEQVVSRATHKDPDQRYATARELADALAAIPDRNEAGETEAEEPPAEEPPAEEAAPEETPPPADERPGTETPDIAVGVTEPRELAAGGSVAGRWIGVGVVLVAVVAGVLWYRSNLAGDRTPAVKAANTLPTKGTREAPAKKTQAPPARAAQPASTTNAWIRVTPGEGKVMLGIDPSLYGGKLDKVVGFRAKAGVVAPGAAYELLQHEVTWGELDPWLAKNPAAGFSPPPWLPSIKIPRAVLPATGVPWATAQSYCRSLGGDLPTEEQWEYAARGPRRRANAWGASPLDLARTRAYRGPDGRPGAVMKADQDRTPGAPGGSLYDMMGNAQEWTLDPFRSDETGAVDAWVQSGKKTFRAIRGLPLREAPPEVFPREGATYRNALCAPASECPAETARARHSVGFRCARAVR